VLRSCASVSPRASRRCPTHRIELLSSRAISVSLQDLGFVALRRGAALKPPGRWRKCARALSPAPREARVRRSAGWRELRTRAFRMLTPNTSKHRSTGRVKPPGATTTASASVSGREL